MKPLINLSSAFPENFVIEELRKSSVEFQRFYDAERKTVTRKIYWIQDISLPKGIDYRSTRLPTLEQIIRLRRVPAVIGDACKIAHEIEHFVLDAEGFSPTGATSEYETLSSAINSMVTDILVNTRLKQYGFDLREDYETEMAETKRQLGGIAFPPTDRFGRMIWIANYVSNVLDWELAYSGNGDNEFRVWFKSRYPEIAARGEKLLEMVNRIGYDTPEKQKRLFGEIIRRYNLEGFVFL